MADLFAQVDALQANDRDHDLDELAAFDMNMRASRLNDEHQRDSRIFLDSYERDTDLLHDDNDMQELQFAQSILQECGLDSSGKKIGGQYSGGLGSPTASDLEKDTFQHQDIIMNRLSDLQGHNFNPEQELEDIAEPLRSLDREEGEDNEA